MIAQGRAGYETPGERALLGGGDRDAAAGDCDFCGRMQMTHLPDIINQNINKYAPAMDALAKGEKMINKITPDDLALHTKWLRGESGGVKIATSWYADLRGTNLSDTDLRYANLSGADLRYANLSGADLSDTDLRYADLRGTNLSRANLSGANLSGADLSDTDLSGANLSRANLLCAKNIPDYAIAVTQIVPEGDLIVYKKLRDDKIAKLLVPKEAKRSNATERKCRAEYAQVLAIESVDGKTTFDAGVSQNDCNFVYKVGEPVRPDSWDEDRWNECSHGIHFFLTRYEAENY